MKKTLLFLLVPMLVGFLLAGCSSTTEPQDTAADLENFGSYTAANEAPAFGDAYIESIMDARSCVPLTAGR